MSVTFTEIWGISLVTTKVLRLGLGNSFPYIYQTGLKCFWAYLYVYISSIFSFCVLAYTVGFDTLLTSSSCLTCVVFQNTERTRYKKLFGTRARYSTH